MIVFLLAGIFAGILIVTTAILWTVQKRMTGTNRQIIKRVDAFTHEETKAVEKDIPDVIRDDRISQIPFLNHLLRKYNITDRLRRLLDQAGMNMKVGQLVLLIMVLASTGYLLGLKSSNLLLKFLLIIILGALPLVYVHMQRINRLKAFIRAFPDSIDMMISAIKAGHAFNQAMQLVGNEAPDPVGTEFKRSFEQYNLGLNLKDVLLNMTDRVESLDLKLFVTAILLQRETGGNLTEILEKISMTIRDRFKLIGQIKTFTAQGRMSAWILGSMPIVFVLAISALNPDYLEPLFHDKLGHYVIGIASVMQIIGFLVIHKIVQIKYQ